MFWLSVCKVSSSVNVKHFKYMLLNIHKTLPGPARTPMAESVRPIHWHCHDFMLCSKAAALRKV